MLKAHVGTATDSESHMLLKPITLAPAQQAMRPYRRIARVGNREM